MDEMLTPKDVEKILPIGQKNVYKLFHTSGFPAVQIGRKYLISRQNLEEWLDMYKGKRIILED